MFGSILSQTGATMGQVAICSAVSIVLGLIISIVYMYKSEHSKSFATTLVLLPVIVQAIIMLVNGAVGVGLAVAGAFGLVRFRSVPGKANEICSVFFAMTVGLATGLGNLSFAVMFTIAVCAILFLLSASKFGESDAKAKELKVTIPENLDYTDMFEDLFDKYVKKHTLRRVKTTNMGSMYELTYDITLKDDKLERAMIDEIRCRNGNLPVSCYLAGTDTVHM